MSNKYQKIIFAIETSRENMLVNKKSLETHDQATVLEFWARILENSESIVLLLQNGYINEALSIHRLSIEHLANFVGLLQSKCTVEELAEKAEADLAAQAKILKERDDRTLVLTNDNREKLSDFLTMGSKRAPAPGLNTHNLLHACNLDFYHTKYRLLSIRAAHSTLLSAVGPGTPDEAEKLESDVIELLNFLRASTADFLKKSE